MANIKELIQSIESEDSSFDDKLAAINQMEETLVAMKEHEQEAIDDNVELIIEALRTIEAKVEAKLRIIPEKGEQGIQGQKGEQGDRGLDGAQGKDGKPGIDGKDGLDGKDGVSVQDAKIDFDGSLVITLSDGREINVGEVVPVDVAEKIRTVHNIQSGSGGDSQTVLDAIAALQATIATYGTMATQNANNVAITGGTINNTTIGATTPSTGVFTTLTATGSGAFGTTFSGINRLVVKGGASAQCFRVEGVSGGFVNLDMVGNRTSGNLGGLRAFYETDSNEFFGIYPQATKVNTFFNLGNGSSAVTTQFALSHTASAVNYVQVTGAATGSGPIISAQGSDADVRLNLSSKGTNSIDILTNSSSQRQFRFLHTASALNYFQATGGATGFGPVLSAQGSDTNIPAVVQPKGTGALQAQQTDSTATGGNARGANAVDWQTLRSSAAQVSNGAQSVVSGGQNNTSSGTASVVGGGFQNTASGLTSVVSGGAFNTASQTNTYIGGGTGNAVSNYGAVVAGGQANTAGGFYNFVGTGFTNSGTSASTVTTQSATMNATTAVTLSGSNANIKVGQLITGTSIANFTYVAAISGTSLTLSQAASGSSTSTLSFFTPHGVVVGGGNNQATGSYSFIGGGGDAGTAANRNVASGDWSFVGGGSTNTASGIGSVICGGGTNGSGNFANGASGTASSILGGLGHTASGTGSSVLGGYNNVSNGSRSTVLSGRYGTTRSINGNVSIPACDTPIAQASGVSQTGILVLARQTTDATATVLASDTSAAGTTNQVILPNNSAYYFRGEVVSGVTGGGNTKGWFIEGVIKRGANAASTALVGTPTVTSTYADAGASTWVIAVTADTTNGGLAVTFTGQAATTIRTVCRVNTTEMTF